MAERPSGKPQPNPRALAIVDAARICFERHGFHAASMARIAAEAGISVGHIYRYFENKEAVVAAIVAQDLEAIGRDLGNLTGGPREMADQILDQVQSNRVGTSLILWLEVRAEGARNPKVSAMIYSAEEALHLELRRTILQAWERCGCPAPTAEAQIDVRMSLMGVLIDGLQMRTFHEGGMASAELVDHLRQIMACVLSPTPIFAGSGGETPPLSPSLVG